MKPLHAVKVIAGPTASGKSALALTEAQKSNGVIINADSLQLYNALPILTATPSTEDQQLVPHCLYGILSPNDSITAVEWAQRALLEIHRAFQAGQTPILVGGTGFYLKTLIEGLSPIPEIDPATRIVVQDLMDRIGIDNFFTELCAIDPVICEKIDGRNPQRLMRAMEVYTGTGKPLSYWQTIPARPLDPTLSFTVQIVMPERDVLYARCDQRLDIMIKQGVVEEVRAFDDALMSGKISPESACLKALGFQAFQSHIRGECDLKTALYLAQNDTRHYAKRQVTWFRHQMT